MSETLLFFFVIFALDLLVVAMRAALIHARLPYLMGAREQNQAAIERAIHFLDEPRLRVTLRLAVSLLHFVLAVLVWLLLLQFFPLLQTAGVAAGLLLVSGVLVAIIEFAIEGLILRRTEQWTMRLLWFGKLVDFLLRPITALLMRLLGPSAVAQRQLASVTDDELKSWVEAGQPEGSLEKGERKMIYSIFQFGDTLCREIMVPRIDVYGLEVTTSLDEAIEAFAHSGHSRIPVYSDSIDNILGILYAKDLLPARTIDSQPDLIRKRMRPPYYVPEAKKVDELLREMQLRGVHMAIVVDEYGGTAGIVTLEDIVEEIVGEIRDEYDQGEEQLYTMISPEEYSFIGRIELDTVNELLGTHLSKDVADTLGGFIYGQIGRVPSGGEELELENWVLSVEQISGRRIRLVRARRKTENLPTEESIDGLQQREQAKTD